jgi:hypothetical protein
MVLRPPPNALAMPPEVACSSKFVQDEEEEVVEVLARKVPKLMEDTFDRLDTPRVFAVVSRGAAFEPVGATTEVFWLTGTFGGAPNRLFLDFAIFHLLLPLLF